MIGYRLRKNRKIHITGLDPDVYCTLMDADTGEILYEQYGNRPALIASVSKIMLAYRQIKRLGNDPQAWQQECTLGDEVRFSSLGGTTLNANSTLIGMVDGTMEYLQPGQRISRAGLLYATMVVSGNDSAVAIAVELDGSEEEYIKKVNAQMRARPFSMSRHSKFVRAYGRDCTATARDIAKAMRVILNDSEVAPAFWHFAGATTTKDRVQIVRPDGSVREVERSNTHPFVSGAYRVRLDNALGGIQRVCGKTGTWIVDFAMVTAVECRGKTLIASVLHANSKRKRNEATLELLTRGFRHMG